MYLWLVQYIKSMTLENYLNNIMDMNVLVLAIKKVIFANQGLRSSTHLLF